MRLFFRIVVGGICVTTRYWDIASSKESDAIFRSDKCVMHSVVKCMFCGKDALSHLENTDFLLLKIFVGRFLLEFLFLVERIFAKTIECC